MCGMGLAVSWKRPKPISKLIKMFPSQLTKHTQLSSHYIFLYKCNWCEYIYLIMCEYIYLIMRKDLTNHMQKNTIITYNTAQTHITPFFILLYNCNWCEYTSLPQETSEESHENTQLSLILHFIFPYINFGATAKLSASSLESNMRAMV